MRITGDASSAQAELAKASKLISGFGRTSSLGYHAERMAPLDYGSALWGSRRAVYVRGRRVRRGYVQIGSLEWRHRELFRLSWRRAIANVASMARLHTDLGLALGEATRRAMLAITEFGVAMRRAEEASRRPRP